MVAVSFASCEQNKPSQPKDDDDESPKEPTYYHKDPVEGCLPGLFAVSETQQVYFSKGNLWYSKLNFDSRWEFAVQQYRVLGESNLDIADMPSFSAIDLFNWNTANDPTRHEADDYVGDFEDWGDKPIYNGGNTEVTLQTDSAAGCYTVNVCYSKLIRAISMLPRQLKGYYDIILFDNSSNELARQRYIYQERSGQEHYFVFANALGGIDTLIADGANVLQPELTFNYGCFGNIYTPIDDTENVRLWNQSLVTPWRERNWLWEILSAKGEAAMYDANAEIYDPIIIADADIKMSDKGQLANASFSYLMSESTPMPVILESEEQSRALSQSAADSAEEFNDLSSNLTLAFEVGEKVNVTEVASIAATKLYVTWDESLKDGIEVFVEVDGNSAGSFVTGTDTQPYIVTKTAGQTVQFLTEDDTIESVTVTYYPVTIQAV